MQTSISKSSKSASEGQKKALSAPKVDDAYPFQRQQLPAFLQPQQNVIKATPVIAPAAQYSNIQEQMARKDGRDLAGEASEYLQGNRFFQRSLGDALCTGGTRVDTPPEFSPSLELKANSSVVLDDVSFPDRYFRFADWNAAANSGVEPMGLHSGGSCSSIDDKISQKKGKNSDSDADNQLQSGKESEEYPMENTFQPSDDSRVAHGGMVATDDEFGELQMEDAEHAEGTDSLYYQNQVIFQYYQDRQMQMYNYHQPYLQPGNINLNDMIQQPPAAVPASGRLGPNGGRTSGKSHTKSHKAPIDTSNRKYVCTMCNKRFTRPSTLKTHMNSHTGERPYACKGAGCGWRFTVLSNLKRHTRICPHVRCISAALPVDGQGGGEPELPLFSNSLQQL